MSQGSDVPGMPAAVLRGRGELTIEQCPTPPVGADDVLVEVSYCGVCGSDIHMTLEGWGRPGSIGGHEWTGVVAAVGTNVDAWQIGDAVVGGPTMRCGTCGPCRAGRPSLCEDRDTPGTDEERGAFARYILKHEAELLALPAALSLRDATLTEPLSVALHGITLSRLAPTETTMVIGAGPIGQLVLAALIAKGWTDVGVVEPAPARQALAQALGASSVRHPDELEVPSIAEPDRIVEGAVDVVFECSGHRAAMEAGLAQLRRAGRLMMVGAGIEAPRFDPNRILLNELTITGSFTYDADGFDQALDLLGSGLLPVDLLLEPGDVPLDDLLDAMRRLAAGQIAAKVLVAPGFACELLREETMSDRPKPPRFNHVAMSVPGDLLDEAHRTDLLAFYGEVFGWQEAPGMTIDRQRLVLMAHRYDQFVFLIRDDHPMTAPRLDHWGQAVSSQEELDELYTRTQRYREKDDRVELVELSEESHPGVTIHSFYVRFLLPLMVETQYFAWDR